MKDENPEKIPEKEPTKTDLLHAEVYDRFQIMFGGIYNIIELAIEDKDKADKVKSLIGGVLYQARTAICNQLDNYEIE